MPLPVATGSTVYRRGLCAAWMNDDTVCERRPGHLSAGFDHRGHDPNGSGRWIECDDDGNVTASGGPDPAVHGPSAYPRHLPERGSLGLSGRFHADRNDPRDTGTVTARCACGVTFENRQLRPLIVAVATHCGEPIHDTLDWLLP